MTERGQFSDAELEAALEALSAPGRFEQAEQRVSAVAPQLQRILGRALAEGGWFEEAHDTQIREALAVPEEPERMTALRTLFAEEARMGMLIGVAVGWELARALEIETDKED